MLLSIFRCPSSSCFYILPRCCCNLNPAPGLQVWNGPSGFASRGMWSWKFQTGVYSSVTSGVITKGHIVGSGKSMEKRARGLWPSAFQSRRGDRQLSHILKGMMSEHHRLLLDDWKGVTWHSMLAVVCDRNKWINEVVLSYKCYISSRQLNMLLWLDLGSQLPGMTLECTGPQENELL